MKKIIETIILFCVLYTLLTLSSSILQIIQGQEFDTNVHLLSRGIVTLIGVISLQMIRYIRYKNALISICISYIVSIALVLAEVWIKGFFLEMHRDAYRDQFLNYTIIFIFVLAIVKAYEYFQNKKPAR